MNHQDPVPAEDDDPLDDIPGIEDDVPPVDEYRLSTRPRVVGAAS